LGSEGSLGLPPLAEGSKLDWLKAPGPQGKPPKGLQLAPKAGRPYREQTNAGSCKFRGDKVSRGTIGR